jgi:transposase
VNLTTPRGVLKTFGILLGATRGLPFDRRVESLLADLDDLAAIVRPMLTAWRKLREQIAVFDKAVRALAKKDPTGASRMWGDVDAGDMTSRSVVGWGLADGVGVAFG